MTAQYGLFRNPPHKGEKESDILHARIIPGRTIRIDRVTREISECTSFSPGDVKGLLQAFADVLVSYLEDGDEVELEGLGHFSVSLKCPKITSPRQVRAEDINFKSVNFRCSKEITERLRSMKVERKPGSSKPVKYTVEERKENILKYLEIPWKTRNGHEFRMHGDQRMFPLSGTERFEGTDRRKENS